MFAKERQNKIYEAIMKNGTVEVTNLAKIFDVSIETIRRDLLCMEDARLLKRVHGGAIKLGDMRTFPSLELRDHSNTSEKTELAIAAMEFISEGDIIAVDCGSTANCFAEVLKNRFSSLSVITHSMRVFEILRENEGINVILIGGQYMHRENSFYGTLALDMLEKMHVQKSFIFPSAISLEYGICDFQPDLYAIQKKMIEIGDVIFVLADSSKFEGRAMLKIDDMKKDYVYVTDSAIPDALINLYRDNDFKIYKGEKK